MEGEGGNGRMRDTKLYKMYTQRMTSQTNYTCIAQPLQYYKFNIIP